MRSWTRFFVIVCLSIVAFLLFLHSVIGMPENPNDLNDTSGVPVAYIFATLLMCASAFSLLVSMVSLVICRMIGWWRIKTRFVVAFIANIPLLLTSAFGVFSVIAFSYDSLSGALSGVLFVSVFFCTSTGLLQALKCQRNLDV